MLSDPAEEFETLEEHYWAGKKPGVPELEFTRDDQEIQVDKVRVISLSSEECIRERDGTRVRPYWAVGLDENGAPYPTPTTYGIVVHEACLDIAERAMRTSRRHLRVRSMRTLWKVLRARIDVCDHSMMVDRPQWPTRYSVVLDSHLYHMFLDPVPSVDEDWHEPFVSNDGDWLIEDPKTLMDLTDILLFKATMTASKAFEPATQAFRNRFLKLPAELQEHIILLLGSSGDLPLPCTRLLPQELWRDMLLGKKFLSFLYDIDEAAIMLFVEERRERGEPDVDWESTVRSLSRGLRSFGNVSRDLWETKDINPPQPFHRHNGLRNRRRIWQLAEEMFVGDLLPLGGEGDSDVTVPRYWDEYGDRVYPVVRVSERGDA
ncbi:hypothetical protein PG990_007025 [Apiospora arundinis]